MSEDNKKFQVFLEAFFKLFLVVLSFVLVGVGVYIVEPTYTPLVLGLMLWADLLTWGKKDS